MPSTNVSLRQGIIVGAAAFVGAVQARRIRSLTRRCNQLKWELTERRKELLLLHRVTRVLQQDGDIERVLDEFVRQIPAGWQFPELAAARITAGRIDIMTPSFHVTPWMQQATFQSLPGERGVLQVAYAAATRCGAGEAFLPEERNLIESVAALLSSYFDRIHRIEERVELARVHASQLQAEAANRAKDVFLAMVSHELRRPLTAILGWARMLRQGQSTDLAHGLEVIERSGNIQRRLIEELLDVSQIETGDITIGSGVVDLNDVVKDVADAATPSIITRNIEMTSSTSAGRTPVVGDEMRLQQIFGNLVANAIKFSSDGGRVTLSLTRTESAAEFEVADSGIGMDAYELARIFEPFWQADGSLPASREGLGLGLSIARRLVQLHGGTIEAHSRGPGKGSRMLVRLPLATSAQIHTSLSHFPHCERT